MTQEEKELLTKVLCEQLPYGVQVEIDGLFNGTLKGIDGDLISTDRGIHYPIRFVKPYLRPISSITEDELKDLLVYSGMREHEIEICKYDGGAELEFWLTEVPCKCIGKAIDWLNAKHFDVRGIIGNLALEAPEELYA